MMQDAITVVKSLFVMKSSSGARAKRDLLSRAVHEANKVETLTNGAGKSWIEVLRACSHRRRTGASQNTYGVTGQLIDDLRAADLRCIADLNDMRKFVGFGGVSSSEATRHFESYKVDYSYYERHSDMICGYIEYLDDSSVRAMQQLDLRGPIMRSIIDKAKRNKIKFVNADDYTILPRSIKYMLKRESSLWSTRRQSIAITSQSIAIATPVVGTSIFMEVGARPTRAEVPALGEKQDEGPYLVAVLAARLLVDLEEFESLKFAAKFLSSLRAIPPSEVKEMMIELLQQRLFRRTVTNGLTELSSIYKTSERMFGKGEIAVKTAFRTLSGIMEKGVKLIETNLRCSCLNDFFEASVVAGVLVDRVIEFKDLVKLKTPGGSVGLGFFREGEWSVRARLIEKRAGIFHAEKEGEVVKGEECGELLSGDLF